MPVNQTANLDGIKTAVEALPVQPYKMSQKCMLAASNNNILVNPDANEHGSLKLLPMDLTLSQKSIRMKQYPSTVEIQSR